MTDTLTIHTPGAPEVHDEHGSYSPGPAPCGALGSFYSTDPTGVTCAACRALAGPARYRYEVTVPVVVTIEIGDDGAPTVTRTHIDSGYPGFFSYAEESGGVWDPQGDGWGIDEDERDEDPDALRVTAWHHVGRMITAGMPS